MMRIESPLMLNLHRERQAASLTEDSDTDIAVIGGGISGMSAAYSLLTQTDEPITVIAGKVGYTNTSKFSEAFKKVKGKTPLEYRKIKI